MADFKKQAPTWDVRYKSNGKRAKYQQQRELPWIYYSDYRETGKYLMADKTLRRVLQRETLRLKRNIESEMPANIEGETPLYRQGLNVRYIKRGGYDHDRQAYHIYATGGTESGDAFLSAERRSHFTREEWKKRTKGEMAQATRKGWMEKGLEKSSVSYDALRGRRAPRTSKMSKAQLNRMRQKNLRKGRP